MTITKAQAKTLRTLVRMGGTANFYAGVRGLDSRSQDALAARGLITKPISCWCNHAGITCDAGDLHTVALPHPGGDRVYCRSTITDAGIAAIAEADAAGI